MKVAQKSSASRQTLTITRSAFDILDRLRGETPKSIFIQNLIEKEKRRREREAFYQSVLAAYTPEVCLETLELNEAIPIAAE
jgi:hypothetical protein